MLTFHAFNAANTERCKESSFGEVSWTPQDWACAMAGECGEACNLIKKMRRGQAVPAKDVADELADLITYVDLLATNLGINLEAALIAKFNEISDRRGSAVKL